MSLVYCCLIAETYRQTCYMSWWQRHWMSFVYCCLTAETYRQMCYMSWWQRHWMTLVYCCMPAVIWTNVLHVMMTKALDVFSKLVLDYREAYSQTNLIYFLLIKTMDIFSALAIVLQRELLIRSLKVVWTGCLNQFPVLTSSGCFE